MIDKKLKVRYEEIVQQRLRVGDPTLYMWNTANSRLLDLLHAKLKKDNEMKILELGAGRGHLSDWLIRNGAKHVVTTDFNEVSLDITRELFPPLQLACVDAQKLPFAAGSFDIIVGVELFEHLQNVTDHLLEVKRVLKDEGCYFITTPNRVVERVFQFFQKPEDDEIHISSQSLLSLNNLLIEYGFIPCFYSSRELRDSQIRKISSSKIVALMARKFPLVIIPKLFQQTLICVAKKERLAAKVIS